MHCLAPSGYLYQGSAPTSKKCMLLHGCVVLAADMVAGIDGRAPIEIQVSDGSVVQVKAGYGSSIWICRAKQPLDSVTHPDNNERTANALTPLDSLHYDLMHGFANSEWSKPSAHCFLVLRSCTPDLRCTRTCCSATSGAMRSLGGRCTSFHLF